MKLTGLPIMYLKSPTSKKTTVQSTPGQGNRESEAADRSRPERPETPPTHPNDRRIAN